MTEAGDNEENKNHNQQHPLHRPPRRPAKNEGSDPRNYEEPGESLTFHNVEATAQPLPRRRWKGAVQQVMKQQRTISTLSDASGSQHGTRPNLRHRRQASTGVHDVLLAMQGIGQKSQQQQQNQQNQPQQANHENPMAMPSWTDTIINADEEMMSDLNLDGVLQQATAEAQEQDDDERLRLSFLSSQSGSDHPDGGGFMFGTTRRAGRKEELIPLFENLQEDDVSPSSSRDSTGAQKYSWWTSLKYVFYWTLYSCCCGRTARIVRKVLSHAFYQIRWVLVTIPMTVATVFLYYKCRNPSPDFLHGVTLSWLGNFISRHIVLWNLAQLTQFFIIDIFLMASHKLVHFIGPVATLLLLQARGWPFVTMVWGVLALFLLHGDNEFQIHWLYWTNIDVFAKANSGSYILNSTMYTNLLTGMIVSGVCTAVKRFLSTVYFGRRQFNFFKPRLEKLLQDVVLVSEIATLVSADNPRGELNTAGVDWKTVKRTLKEDRSSNDEYDVDDEQAMVDDSQTSMDGIEGYGDAPLNGQDFQQSRQDSSRGFGDFKNLLDAWEEPTKEGSNGDFRANIADVLQFKRALTYMDDSYPFGEQFGPSSNRDQCIASSHALYQRLCASAQNNTGEQQVPFSVFESLYMDEDGNVDRKLRAKLKQIFPPTSTGQVGLFTFVQSVDSLYRRLRYFSASVRNDASLDKVLENIINGFYYFILGLFLVSLLNYNPWSMLVSITSLLVSLSFAFGQTVSRYVEGILTVAVARPFDLGDRIYLINATTAHTGGDIVGATLFVEDINLSKTKLRYAATGEIMYMSNYLLSTMRIYNLTRSPNAMIRFSFEFSILLLENNRLEEMRTALRQYVADHPVRWESFNFLRVCGVSVGDERVQCQCSLRHRSSWQNAASIKNHQSDLFHFIYEKAMAMGVGYEVSPTRTIIYQGGDLQEGVTDSRLRVDLLRRQNVLNAKGNKEL